MRKRPCAAVAWGAAPAGPWLQNEAAWSRDPRSRLPSATIWLQLRSAVSHPATSGRLLPVRASGATRGAILAGQPELNAAKSGIALASGDAGPLASLPL